MCGLTIQPRTTDGEVACDRMRCQHMSARAARVARNERNSPPEACRIAL
ncbi:hypothetical protein QFZ63_000156 [Streptomyces sp. B3I7]|nr:hypothetical protein [Streptomyces sp. B3I7]